MPDKKLTDNEIIKALDICSKSTNGCSHSKYTCKDCYLNGQPMCSAILLQDAIDLFDRLQAEKSDLEIELKAMRGVANSYKAENESLQEIILTDRSEAIKKLKAEAYKEFAELVKKHSYFDHKDQRKVVAEIIIDHYLKKLVGEKNVS